MIKYLLEKEFKQILRDSFLPKMIIIMPIVMMLMMPRTANQEIRNLKVEIVDNDRSTFSQRFVGKVSASKYFQFQGFSNSNKQAMDRMDSGEIDAIVEIPPDFEKNLMREGKASIMVSSNTVNATKGSLGSSYLVSIINDFSREIREENMLVNGKIPQISISPQNRFNPHLDYKVFMVPAIMVTLLTLMTGFLPALNIVGEKEKGTIEQINVTPVGKFTFIIAKLIPLWVIGFTTLSICFAIAALSYGLFPSGSLLTLYIFAGVYILALSGFGIIISNFSDTMQQAMFVMYFFILVLILMSGMFTPINSMPQWAQFLTSINPLRYFIQVMRMVYLKGSSISDLYDYLLILSGFAVVFNTAAILSFKKVK